MISAKEAKKLSINQNTIDIYKTTATKLIKEAASNGYRSIKMEFETVTEHRDNDVYYFGGVLIDEGYRVESEYRHGYDTLHISWYDSVMEYRKP